MDEGEALNLRHDVERHEDAITQDAAALAEVRQDLVLIKKRMVQIMEVMEDLHRCVYKGGLTDPQLLKAYQHAQQILNQLGGGTVDRWNELD
jgi:hypothetical protein